MSKSDGVKWLKAITYVGIYGGLLVPLVFIPVVIFPFVFSKLIFFQVLIGLTFPAYLILAWAEPEYRPRKVPLTWAILAYLIAIALSVIFAVDPLRAWWGNQERMNGLFTVLHFFAWFLMTSSVLKTWKQWKTILVTEIILSGIGASVALLQIPFPKLLLFPAGPRVGGLLDNPIYMAGYQIFNLFFIALLWLKGVSKYTKAWLIAFALLDIGSFFAAESRGALLGLFVGLAVFAGAMVFLSKNKKAKVSIIALAIFAVVGYGGLFAARNTTLIKDSVFGRLTNFQVATETRFIAWGIAWQGFLERPLTGWGFDNFHILFNDHYQPKSLEYSYYETWFDRAHNTVLDALAMTGLFGFLTYFAIFGALFFSVWRAYTKKWINAPMASVYVALPCAYFVQNLFVFDQPAGFTMSFFMYALIASTTTAVFAGEAVEAKDAKAGRAIPWTAFGIIQVVFLLVVWRYSILPWNASVDSIRSNNEFSAGLLPQSFADAKKAASIPTPYINEQAYLQSRNLMALAGNGSLQKFSDWKAWHDLIVEVSDKYLSEHPRDTNPIFIYARFLDSMAQYVPEDAQKALDRYQQAIQTSPKRQQLYYSLGRFEIQVGKKQEGYADFKKALDFDPNVGESHWYVGLSDMYDMGNKEEGAKELKAAMDAKIPYDLKNVQEAGVLSYAYSILGDADGFKSVIQRLPNLSGGTTQMYMDIARLAEQMGLNDQRNLLLGAIAKIDPTIVPRLKPLEDGTATSIQESFNMTTPPAAPTTTSQAPASVTSPTPTVVATTSGGSVESGPRLK